MIHETLCGTLWPIGPDDWEKSPRGLSVLLAISSLSFSQKEKEKMPSEAPR